MNGNCVKSVPEQSGVLSYKRNSDGIYFFEIDEISEEDFAELVSGGDIEQIIRVDGVDHTFSKIVYGLYNDDSLSAKLDNLLMGAVDYTIDKPASSKGQEKNNRAYEAAQYRKITEIINQAVKDYYQEKVAP